jgi:hypothetical protein
MKTTLLSILLAAGPLCAQIFFVVPAPGNGSSDVTISATNIPSHGADDSYSDQTQYNHTNVFDLSVASTYPDSTVGDWKHYVATANDPVTIQSQDIMVSKQTAPTSLISGFTYGGGTGPTNNYFRSNVFFFWPFSENDLLGIDFTGHYYDLSGNGIAWSRVLGSSHMRYQCATSGTLVSGCYQQHIVTPHKTGPQNIYVWTRTEGVNGKISVTVGGATTDYPLPTLSSAGIDEEQVTIAVNPTVADTPYTIKLSAVSTQSGVSTGYISTMATAVGGATAGNVSDTFINNNVTYTGTPNHTYGSQAARMAPPSSRVPAATTSVTLCLTPGTPVGCVNDTLKHYFEATAVTASASGGVDIHLPLGFIAHTTNLVMANRTNNNWISVIADGAHNTFGERAQPVDYPGGSSSPAIINNVDSTAVIANDYLNSSLSARAAHHYLFKGLKLTDSRDMDGGATQTYYLVQVTPGDHSSTASYPHDIIFQGNYIHGDPSMPQTVNGVLANMNNSALYDNYIDGIYLYGGGEAHGILAVSLLGPLEVINNHIEARSENVLIGGQMPQPFGTPTDLTFKHNYFTKGDADCTKPYASGADPKNGLEFKAGNHVTVQDNFFWKICANSQQGNFIFIRNPTNFGMTSQHSFLVRDNLARHVSSGIAVEGVDAGIAGGPAGDGHLYNAGAPLAFTPKNYDILVENNAIEDISYQLWNSTYYFTFTTCLGIGGLPTNLTFNRNQCDWNATDVALNHDHMGAFQLGDKSSKLFADQGTCGSDRIVAARLESLNSWVFTNNILAGENGMACQGGPAVYTEDKMGSFANNSFYNQYYYNSPAHVWDTFTQLGGGGNTSTSDSTVPVVSGRGVDKSLMSPECQIKTGNRSDISCTPGN